MSTRTKSTDAAHFLFDQHQARRQFAPLPKAVAPQTIDEAYLVQGAYLDLMSQQYGPLAGYKLAYTTPTMQERAGLTEPCAGGILADTILPSPATLASGQYLKLGIECEVAVELGAELPASGAPYTRDQVAQAISVVMAAFEMVDFRTPDLQGQARALTAISTNISNAGVSSRRLATSRPGGRPRGHGDQRPTGG